MEELQSQAACSCRGGSLQDSSLVSGLEGAQGVPGCAEGCAGRTGPLPGQAGTGMVMQPCWGRGVHAGMCVRECVCVCVHSRMSTMMGART